MKQFLPRHPRWSLDWEAISAAYTCIDALRGSSHDPVHHQEGDVWVHTRMVVEELINDTEWQALDEDTRLVVFAAAVLHDIAKPATEEIHQDGRVTNKGHSKLGARMAREILWKEGWNPEDREKVCALIERHQVPFWLWEKNYLDILRVISSQSLSSGNNLLYLLASADARGRICADRQWLIDGVDAYRDLCVQHNCFTSKFPFFGKHERFMFLSERANIDPTYKLYSHEMPTIIIMSALPGAGKSTWIAKNAQFLPVISLDDIRKQMKVRSDEPQHAVIFEAYERAKTYLRAKQEFVWDTTNITKDMRNKITSLAVDYGFRIKIVAVEAAYDELLRRNRSRNAIVPETIIHKLIKKWEFPRHNEYHELEWVV